MELTKLRYFYEVAKYEHVTRASEHLHIAQPALTQAIKSLESELGVALFYKSGRNIYLTESGKYLRDKLETIIRDIDALPEEVAKITSREDKVVRLNIVSASILVINAIMQYKKNNPDVVFKFSQDEENLGWDILVTTDEAGVKRNNVVAKRKIMEEKICVAVPYDSKWAKRDSVDLIELKAEGFVTLSGFKRFRSICDKYCALLNFSPRIIFESDTIMAVQNIVGSGMGVGFWPEFSWSKPDDGKVKLVNLVPDCKREIIVELADKQPLSSCCEKFYEFLIEYLDNLR
ncbi:MAG: LysR family transcriptional regulator [Clostridia bacterium]|nr:LysR family transcriptional regulator [Clostridia bacterium]